MTGYRTDQQALSATALGLDQSAESLRDGTQALRDTYSRTLGTGRLTAIVADLLDRSAGELADVLTELTDASTGVRRCLTNYTETEHRITDLLLGNPPPGSDTR